MWPSGSTQQEINKILAEIVGKKQPPKGDILILVCDKLIRVAFVIIGALRIIRTWGTYMVV